MSYTHFATEERECLAENYRQEKISEIGENIETVDCKMKSDNKNRRKVIVKMV